MHKKDRPGSSPAGSVYQGLKRFSSCWRDRIASACKYSSIIRRFSLLSAYFHTVKPSYQIQHINYRVTGNRQKNTVYKLTPVPI